MSEKAIIEGLLFLNGDEGLSLGNIASIIEKDEEYTKKIIEELSNDYKKEDRGLSLELFGNKFKLTTKKEHKEFYKKLITIEENAPLSQAALETLAIIAYNGPITRAEIDEIRGVSCIYVLRKLLLKNLVEEVGRSDSPGRPILYNVTNIFLDYFGLNSVEELPKLNEIKEEPDDESNLFESKYIEKNDMD